MCQSHLGLAVTVLDSYRTTQELTCGNELSNRFIVRFRWLWASGLYNDILRRHFLHRAHLEQVRQVEMILPMLWNESERGSGGTRRTSDSFVEGHVCKNLSH